MQPIVYRVYGSGLVLTFYLVVLLVVIACDSPHIGSCGPDCLLLIKKKWIQIPFKQINSPVSLSLAILVYRVFRNEAKRNIKLLHGIIHLLALIISIVGKWETKRFSCVKECLHKCIKNKNDPPPLFHRFCRCIWLPQRGKNSRHVFSTQLAWHGYIALILHPGTHSHTCTHTIQQ